STGRFFRCVHPPKVVVRNYSISQASRAATRDIFKLGGHFKGSSVMQPRRVTATAAEPLLPAILLCVGVLAMPAAGALPACPGDLNGDGKTTVDEIVAAVDAALTGCSAAPSIVSAPPVCAGDLNGDGKTTVEEIVAIVQAS